MKQIPIAIAALMLVGCGESDHQHSYDHGHTHAEGDNDHAESDGHDHDKELKAAETATREPPTAEAPDISIYVAAVERNIEAIKKHLAAGVNVNAKDFGATPLHASAGLGHKEIVELLIAEGADINAGLNSDNEHKGKTPLDAAIEAGNNEIADLLRKHGGKTGEELKVAGN